MSITDKAFLVVSGVIAACAIAATANNIIITKNAQKKYEQQTAEVLNRFNETIQNAK